MNVKPGEKDIIRKTLQNQCQRKTTMKGRKTRDRYRNEGEGENTGKTPRFWGKNEGELTRKAENSSRKKSLAVGEACMAMF